MNKWIRAKYQPNLPLYPGKYVTASAEHIALSLQAAEEGIVLLKNDNRTLPLALGTKVALLGKGSFDYVKGGGGSGDVNTSYIRNIHDGIKEDGGLQIFEPAADFYRAYVEQAYKDGAAPGMLAEPALDAALVQAAAAFTDTAIVVISRFSGEGWDRSSVECDNEFNPWESETSMPKISAEIFPEGDFYLTSAEKTMLQSVTDSFAKVIVLLNIGGIIDTSWIRDSEKIQAAVHMGQGGMEGGLAAAHVLTGRCNPSGKLTDTYAANLNDYPSTENFHESFDFVNYTEDIYVGYRYFETLAGAKAGVIYPFGYGLSYTDFDIEVVKAELITGSESIASTEKIGQTETNESAEISKRNESAGQIGDRIQLTVRVTNTGETAGKEVVQVYYGAPQGKLQKPAKELLAFRKTRLLQPGEQQVMKFALDANEMASYDDLGKITKSAFVLEAGNYRFFVGNSVEASVIDFAYEVKSDRIVLQLTAKCVPNSLEKRLLADGSYEALPTSACPDKDACIFEKMVPGTDEAIVPETRGMDRYLMMKPYGENGRPLMDVVEGKITLDDFVEQFSDEQLISILGGQPNTGVSNTFGYGNIPEFGVPNVTTADGPAGVRIDAATGICTTAWPCATMLAMTWNPELVEKVGFAGGEELKENNLSVWLTPAINIHRNPMCGRNFEYYSEDPYLTGKMGAAMVRGIQTNHVAASVKHFAVNNKETNRKHSDSRLSERALREIYLKAFEIIVAEADPWTIMSSYNVINGVRASENKELLEDILRGEWNFKGMVTSDWWTRAEHYKEILAGNDAKMASGYPDRVKKAMEMGALTRADLIHCAKRVLELIMKID